MKYLLKTTGKKYVTTDWTLDMCAYEAIVNSLYSTLSKDEHLSKNYKGLDLYWGTCNTFCTALNRNYQTLSNSPEPYQTYCTILKCSY